MTVRVAQAGPVWTVTLDRPEVRNAVDTPHAEQLTEAFLAFDADPDAAVAVLWGAGGNFCAGADLKAVAAGTMVAGPPGEGPAAMGPTRL
ncbi:MAG: enoyl-CoA hydratase-related protein, partial [Kineosporiaceae bacterium]